MIDVGNLSLTAFVWSLSRTLPILLGSGVVFFFLESLADIERLCSMFIEKSYHSWTQECRYHAVERGNWR